MIDLNYQQIEKLRTFSDCFVEHPIAKAIFNDFDELRLNRNFQSDQQCMLLTGDTGVGKSHLINHYKKRVLASQNYGRDRMPVLISRISSNRGLDSTLIQMLADLELFGSEQRKKRGYDTDLTKKLVNSLIRAEVELLIINEFQEIIEFKTAIERKVIADALKYISEEARVPIVLVGMPWAVRIADEPQWSSRLIRRKKLEYFSLQKSKKYYLQYLMGLAKHMPFDLPPKLEDKHIAVPLFAACRGENRILKHLLIEVLKIALRSNAVNLDIKYFIEAYNCLFPSESEDKQNPFKQKVEDIKISELLEYSKYYPNALNPDEMIGPRKFTEAMPLSMWLTK